MVGTVNYSDNYLKQLLKLYYKAHNIPLMYDNDEYFNQMLPSIKEFKIKLLKINNKLRGYVFYKDYGHNFQKGRINIEEIFIDKNYDDESNYTILLESLNKGFFYKKYLSAQFLLDNKRDTFDFVFKLNLILERKSIEMKIEINKELPVNTEDNINFYFFKKDIDENNRINIQNLIFKETTGHIDIDIDDIRNEELQDYFIEDGCIFLKFNNIIAGYSQIILENSPSRTPYIVNFGIDKPFRKMGLSKLLLNYTLNVIRKKGYNEACVTVDSSNRKAQNLYKKSGFKKVATYSNYLYMY
jgi:ribosomal protein S18 acetylase RimI-like enzyme